MLKDIMKKALVATSLVGMIATSVNAAADDTIVITGTVSDSMVVGFQDVSAEAASTGRFVGADVALGAVLPGSTWTAQTKNIFVNTNSTTGVKMTIDDAAGAAGVLQGPGANVAVTYNLMGAGYTVDSGTAVSLVAVADAGSVSVGDLIITPAATGGAQTVGTYTVTLNVTLAAN